MNFNRQKDGDAYFLNTIDVTLHKTGESVPRQQTFDIERDQRITALQAYKLLSGLSLEKDIYVRPKDAESDEVDRIGASGTAIVQVPIGTPYAYITIKLRIRNL
jgi:hypothetical protein